MDGRMARWMGRWIDVCMYASMGGWMNGQRDGWVDGWMSASHRHQDIGIWEILVSHVGEGLGWGEWS